MEVTIEGLQRQRAHLSRCQRSVAFDFALTVLAGGDTTELRAEYWRLDANIRLLDRWIREMMITDSTKRAIEGVERMLDGQRS